MNRFALSAVVIATLGACASQQPKDAPKAAVEQRTVTQTQTQTQPKGADTKPLDDGSVATKPLGAAQGTDASKDPLRDPASPLSKRTIFFDYDSFTVRDEYRDVIQAHANYLSSKKSTRVTLAGHADERGSREYNLALGQKRADAVRRALTVLGVGENQIESISFGEEKPRSTGHDDASYAENRRTDISYPGE